MIVSSTSSATTAAKAPSAASTASSRTISLRLCFVHGQGAAAHVRSVESSNGLLRFSRVGHFDEREAARTSGITVGHHGDLFHLTVGLENTTQIGLGRTVRQIANIEILHNNSYPILVLMQIERIILHARDPDS